MQKPSPNKQNDNAKRARQNSPREEQQHGGQEDELYLELFDLIRTLQAKDETKEEQLKVLQTQLDQALAEIKSLHTIVEAFKDSLEYTQKQQEDANERIGRCESDQDRQEDELIRQSIYSRRWNLIFHGVSETEEESCSDLVKHIMVSKLKIDKRKVKGIMFCGAHRLGKKKRSGNSNSILKSRQLEWPKIFHKMSARLEENPCASIEESQEKGRNQGDNHRRSFGGKWQKLFFR